MPDRVERKGGRTRSAGGTARGGGDPDRGGRVLELRPIREGEIRPIPPYNLVATAYKPSHFPSRNVLLEDHVWYQALVYERTPLGVTMRAEGPVDDPLVKVTVHAERDPGPDLVSRLLKELAYRYGMTADLAPFYERFAGDDLLGPVIRRWRGMQVSASGSLFEFLVITVVLQNATVRRTAQMMDNLITHYGYPVVFAGKEMGALGGPELLDHATEDDLRRLKLGYRARTIRRLTDTFVRGGIDEIELRSLDTDALRKRLLSLHGVGPASVWYLLFEVFRRYDVFQHISPWEQKIFSRLLFGEELVPVDRIVEFVTQRWAGWRMLAVHYLFEDLFWQRLQGTGPAWLDELVRL